MNHDRTLRQIKMYNIGIIAKISHSLAQNLRIHGGRYNTGAYITDCRRVMVENGLSSVVADAICYEASQQAETDYLNWVCSTADIPGDGGSCLTAEALIKQDVIALKGFLDLIVVA